MRDIRVWGSVLWGLRRPRKITRREARLSRGCHPLTQTGLAFGLDERDWDRLPATRPVAGRRDGQVVGFIEVPFYTERAEVMERFATRGRNLYRARTGRDLPP
jgi:hypothetical protein